MFFLAISHFFNAFLQFIDNFGNLMAVRLSRAVPGSQGASIPGPTLGEALTKRGTLWEILEKRCPLRETSTTCSMLREALMTCSMMPEALALGARPEPGKQLQGKG